MSERDVFKLLRPFINGDQKLMTHAISEDGRLISYHDSAESAHEALTDKPISQLARERKLDRILRGVATLYTSPQSMLECVELFGRNGLVFHMARQAFNTDKG